MAENARRAAEETRFEQIVPTIEQLWQRLQR